jgi:putative ABC transport system permease protein
MFSPPDRHLHHGLSLALCVALALIVGWNALALIGARQQRIAHPSGLAEDGLSSLRVAGERAGCCRSDDDLAAVRALPGVLDAAIVNQSPYASMQWRVGVAADIRALAHPASASMYAGSDGLLRTMGSRLVAGRDFRADDYRDARPDYVPDRPIPAAIVSRALARRLFGNAPALGRRIVLAHDSAPRVVGIVERLAAPPPGWHSDRGDDTLLLPIRPTRARNATWLIRSAPGDEARALDAVAATLQARGHVIVRERGTFADARRDALAPYRHAIAAIGVGAVLGWLASAALMSTILALWLARLQPTLDLHRALGAGRGRLRRRLHGDVLIASLPGLGLGAPAAWALQHASTAFAAAAPPSPPALAALILAIALLPQCIALPLTARAVARSPALANRGAIMRPSFL